MLVGRSCLCLFAFVLVSIHSGTTSAEIVRGRVVEIAVSSASSPSYGGCYAQLDTPLSAPSVAGGCTYGKYVTFDCNGELGGSRSLAKDKYAVAQLAYVTQDEVYMDVDVSKNINGICFADRAIIFK